MRGIRKETLAIPLVMAVAFWPGFTDADPVSDIGVSDTEIRIGNIMPYTGPLAAGRVRDDRKSRSGLFRYGQR